MISRLCSLLLVICSLSALEAAAVIIDSGDGTGNDSAPTAPYTDPGWANLGNRNGLSAIYLGDGWVMTAIHVTAGSVFLQNAWRQMIPGTVVELAHPPSDTSDVMLYRIEDLPGLPTLPIRTSQPVVGQDVMMIGKGKNRGAAFSFFNPPNQDDGYYWLTPSGKMRWGTNKVQQVGFDILFQGYNSRTLSTDFTRNGTTHECQVATGDSGGALFIENGGTWELAGLLYARVGFGGQPPQPENSALYGNLTYVADLSFYRDQIIDIMTPDCGNGHLTIDEECDDGNNVDGDCCSSTCTLESNGSPCEDGDFCTGGDTCDGAGSCDTGTSDPCTNDEFCDGEETCDSGTGCGPGTPPVIEDNDACTLDSCDEILDQVLNEPVSCDDGDPCTADSCDTVSGCGHAPVIGPGCPGLVPSASTPGHAVLLLLLGVIGLAALSPLVAGTGSSGNA